MRQGAAVVQLGHLRVQLCWVAGVVACMTLASIAPSQALPAGCTCPSGSFSPPPGDYCFSSTTFLKVDPVCTGTISPGSSVAQNQNATLFKALTDRIANE